MEMVKPSNVQLIARQQPYAIVPDGLMFPETAHRTMSAQLTSTWRF